MSATQAAVEPILCDGCTRQATPEHLRRRIARLEWASRFRPIHVSTLFLMPAPPVTQEDYFYHPSELPKEGTARAMFEDVLAACGVRSASGDKEAALREFQHKGFFMAEAIECSIEPEEEAGFGDLLSGLMPTLERRIRHSYRPKSVLLVSDRLRGVAKTLPGRVDAEVLLWEEEPVALANAADNSDRGRFRSQVASLLSRSS